MKSIQATRHGGRVRRLFKSTRVFQKLSYCEWCTTVVPPTIDPNDEDRVDEVFKSSISVFSRDDFTPIMVNNRITIDFPLRCLLVDAGDGGDEANHG